jgi:hypothetical protein
MGRLCWDSNGVKIYDMHIGSIIESEHILPIEKAWEEVERAFPGIYSIEQLVKLSDKGWAVYD